MKSTTGIVNISLIDDKG